MRNPLYPKINDNIPNYIKEEYPTLHNLVVNYFKWLETDENFLHILVNFTDDIEVNNQIKPYIDIIKNELGWNYNANLKIDDKTLIKLLRDFYLSRGSEQSFKILYKILFGADIEIVYPRDDLFKLSDNNYIIQHTIITTAENLKNDFDNFSKLFDTEILSISILGLVSNSSMIIDKIDPILINNTVYLKISLSRTNNDFIPFEHVKIYNESTSFIEKVYAKLTYNITNRGYGYKEKDELLIDIDPSISNEFKLIGKVIVDTITTGGINKIGIDSYFEGGLKKYHRGTHYISGDKVRAITLDGSDVGFDAKVVVTTIKQAVIQLNFIHGIINALNITQNGRGYLIPPKIVIKDTRPLQGGTNASYICDVDVPIVKNYIGDVRIFDGGHDYISSTIALTISAPGGGGIQATGTAYIENGEVVRVVITEPGDLYDDEYPPTIAVTEDANSSAVIYPIMMGDITQEHILKITGGEGYGEFTTAVLFDPPASRQSFATAPIYTLSLLDGTLNPVLIDGGYGYETVPNFVFNGENGLDFAITLSANNYQIQIVDYTSGYGYTGIPTLIIDEPENVGRIEYIDIINPGEQFIDLTDVELEVVSTNGSGAILYPISHTIGQIKKLKEVLPYALFDNNKDTRTQPIEITATFETNNTAKITVDYNTCINRIVRYNENNNGLLGINCYLHDSYYYQQFSYLTLSEYPTKYTEEIVNDLLHPIGFLKFSKFKVNYEVLLDTFQIVPDLLITKILHLNVIKGYNQFFSEIVPEMLVSHEFSLRSIALSNIAQINDEIITFNINNIIDKLFTDNFTLSIENYQNYEMGLFDGASNLHELGALDIQLTLDSD